MSERLDVVVLGAGIVGVSAALQLQRRGRRVTLVDRREPGQETSFGNAGVIEGGSYVPLAFPRDPMAIARYATNLRPELRFHWSFLPRIAPWLWRLFRNSSQAKLRTNGAAIMTLTASAIGEHRRLLGEAGAEALLRENGWLRVYRTEGEYEADGLERTVADEEGIGYTVLDTGAALDVEPYLKPEFAKAVHWHEIASVSDPAAVTAAYAGLFAQDGGEIRTGEARRLVQQAGAWRVDFAEGTVEANDVVVALGPWSADLLRPLGYRFPLAVKRGYHRHYRAEGGATLSRPVVDNTNGYVLAPMAKGIRITTGIEFAARDARPTPVQLGRVERKARELFPLGEGVEAEPWMGRRPCLPDSLPIVGEAPGHRGLWLDFGHAHLGLTLGPVTGKLLADLMTGAPPFVDASPFVADRFLERFRTR